MLKGNLSRASVYHSLVICREHFAACSLWYGQQPSSLWDSVLLVPQKSELTLALANMLGCNVRAQVIYNTRKKK